MYKVLVYGFPLLLLVFEWGLRTVMHVDSSGFTGPTLAAAGLSFLMPLTKLKTKLIDIPGGDPVLVMSRADEQLVGLIWLLVLSSLFAWAFSCYLSVARPALNFYGTPGHFLVGLTTYVLSLVMTAFKGRV